jgi:hypothetical protein
MIMNKSNIYYSIGLLLACLLPLSLSAQNNMTELQRRLGLPNFFEKVKNGRPVTIAYLGGSITLADKGYRDLSLELLRQAYPQETFKAVNAGVGGTGSDLGACRLGLEVLANKPDLVFVEFAVNDADFTQELTEETMEGIVRQIWMNDPHTDICFLYTLKEPMYPVLRAGKLPVSMTAMEKIAAHYDIPSVSLGLEVLRLADKGDLVWKGKAEEFPDKLVFSKDGTHPYTETGHLFYGLALSRSFSRMDVPAGKPEAHPLPAPLTTDRWEQANMLRAGDLLAADPRWRAVEKNAEGPGKFIPAPFSALYRPDTTGASFRIRFRGTMIGLYDLIGPGSGVWEVSVDGVPARRFERFDSYATSWRPSFFKLDGLTNTDHEVIFTVSAQVPDKKKLLGAAAGDLDIHPGKYSGEVGYVGYILLCGKLLTQ